MHVTKEKLAPRAKSYTSIYDLFGSTPFNNIRYKNLKKPNKYLSVFQAKCGDSAKNGNKSDNVTRYVTSEQCQNMNTENSIGSVVHSTSTIFYDLDDLAKRHSFHVLHEINSSNVNLLKVMTIPLNTKGFQAKSDAIVQECATQIKPNLIPRDSVEITTKKIKKQFPGDTILSSEIFLRDDIYSDNKKCYYGKEVTDKQQKFWSFAKYKTEYTNPVPEEKKHKKKDRGKRTEDPCPCQLFSYACPCTDKKSLTELAKKKSITVNQVTSTEKLPLIERKEVKDKKSKNCSTQENKQTDYNVITEKYEVVPIKHEPVEKVKENHANPTLIENMTHTENDHHETISNKIKAKSIKRRKKIKCPNCKENVDISLSTTEEEESIKYVNSSIYRFNEHPSKNSFCSKIKSNGHKCYISEDNCTHNPRCELVPVCQILPTENIYLNHKCTKRQTSSKQPKVIRITKACRHHPPCTVVPSCQRTNVLKNNCEFIPPCLHRPRCVNLPLCVPASKTFHYEEPPKLTNDVEVMGCPHLPRCKYYPGCQHDHVITNLDIKTNAISSVQNNCEFHKNYRQAPYTIHPKMSQKVLHTVCCCEYSKSCQFDCTDCKCSLGCNTKESTSSEAVVFIRDVGCQFKTKRCSPNESALSKISSASFDMIDDRVGKYYSTVHTLRYEDKWTNPVEEDELSEISISVTTFDSHCPTHGDRSPIHRNEKRSGFNPKLNVSPYVAYATHRSPMVSTMYANENNDMHDERASSHVYRNGTFTVKSRRSLKGKCKRIFSVKRRRKSKASSHGFAGYPVQKAVYV